MADRKVPDPSNAYERSHPENEAGMGRLDNNKAVPTESDNKQHQTVKNRQDPDQQVNAQDVIDQRKERAVK